MRQYDLKKTNKLNAKSTFRTNADISTGQKRSNRLENRFFCFFYLLVTTNGGE